MVNDQWDSGRTHITRKLWKHWNWVQPTDQFKDMAYRKLLRTLHRKGLIDYPPSRFSAKNVCRTTARFHVDQTSINCTIKELIPLRVEMVQYAEHEPV